MAQVITSLDGVNLRDTWLTIGSFDGVHIGHQKLIRELNHQAHQAEAKSVVLTFDPHPSVVLRGRTGAFYLTTIPEKTGYLEDLGIDIIVIHPFTHEISQSTAKEFVMYLYKHLEFHQLWAGRDFALGRGREGNVSYLKALGQDLNYQVQIADPVMDGGRIISSSHIRNLLTEGSIENANLLLGRPYRISGEVVHGDGRGKRIGIPTANLDTGAEKLIPGAGVYACKVYINNQVRASAVNIGTRPTFESKDRASHIEAHILDYSDDLYGQEISLEFIGRLRGEVRFDSVEALITQIHHDIDKTREMVGVFQNQ